MTSSRIIDGTDIRILEILQKDARTPNAEVARRLGMAPSAIFERIRKLETRQVIRGYESRLEPKALGLGLLCYVFVRAEEPAGAVATGHRLAEIPEVQEVHNVAGEDCYLVKLRCADTEDLGRILRERIGAIPSVRSTRSTIVLNSLKESGQLPLPEPGTLETGDAA